MYCYFLFAFQLLKFCEIALVNLVTVIFTKYLEIHGLKWRRQGLTNTFGHRLYLHSLFLAMLYFHLTRMQVKFVFVAFTNMFSNIMHVLILILIRNLLIDSFKSVKIPKFWDIYISCFLHMPKQKRRSSVRLPLS